MNTAGGIIHDQADADTDASIQERIAIGIGKFMCVVSNLMCVLLMCYILGSTAAGVGDSVDDENVQAIAKGIEKTSEKMAEKFEEERQEKEEENEEEEEEDQWEMFLICLF